MLLIPASGTALLSRRYGRYQLLQQRSDGVVREMRETYDGAEEVEKKKQRGSALLQVAEVASRPVFAALLQRTVMPVVSYSVCGGVPLAYVCDATDVAGTWVEPTLAVSLPVGGG
ncbi:hypothetical protein DQ04_05381070 [Trypanosoma grayi]|uniref:hypothetical protein n=1 Tax=Trypanosoma grayi TaxID=71804 RepID=UPI0004F44931|nr:hypothetical protein DQ04_05381070 [Trypanosoma grayi]KEG09344.1 hypothetical protein DQ04_05381070 [Trypanosoma grayi]